MIEVDFNTCKPGLCRAWYDQGCVEGWLEPGPHVLYHNDDYVQGRVSTRPCYKYALTLTDLEYPFFLLEQEL